MLPARHLVQGTEPLGLGRIGADHEQPGLGVQVAAAQPRRNQASRVISGMPGWVARSRSHHSCSARAGRLRRAGMRERRMPRARSRSRTAFGVKAGLRLGGRKPSALSRSAICAVVCPLPASPAGPGSQLRVVAELGQAGHRAGDLRGGAVPPAQVISTSTFSLVPSRVARTCSTRCRISCLRSAPVVVAASQTAGRSAARARICSRSAAVSVRGRRRNRSYSSPSRCRSARAASQSLSSCRTTRRFSGSASWYWRRARSAA